MEIDESQINCENMIQVLNPDNDENITMSCDGSLLKIKIIKLKISSLYNTVEDIMRCYEISKNIDESRM